MTQSDIAEKLEQIKQLVNECLSDLDTHAPAAGRRKALHTPRPSRATKLDFDVNERAFMKTHGRGLSGQKKFVLLAAYLAKGQVGKEVQLEIVRKHWNRMKSLLDSEFNTFYSNTAKDNGWVDTRKKGVYVLSKSWQQVFRK